MINIRAFQGEIYVWLNRQILGGGGWSRSRELSSGSRNDLVQLWGQSQVQGHGAECSLFAPYWFSWADHFHLIDFLHLLVCVFLLVRGHFVPFRFIFGLLLLPLVSVCSSNHDSQIFDQMWHFHFWQFYCLGKTWGCNQEVELTEELGLSSALLIEVSPWVVAQRHWDYRRMMLSTRWMLGWAIRGRRDSDWHRLLTLLSHSRSYNRAKFLEDSCEMTLDKLTALF